MKLADEKIIELLEAIKAGSVGGGGSGGGLENVVEDTTPQLGGTLDFNGHGALYTNKFRVKTDGSFQLFNSDTSKYHTLTISGADGALVINIAAGEA